MTLLLLLVVEMIIPYLINFSDTRPSSQWGNEIMKVIYEIVLTWPLVVMIIPSWWKWVWKHGGDAESVAKKGVASCLPSKVLQHQSATTPKCYDTKVLRHQSATSAPKWCHQHDALLVAHRSMGGGWRNTKGLREEMEMVILKKYKRWFGRNTNTGGTGN